MSLTGLLAQYGLIQARLHALMLGEDLPATDLSLLFRQASDLRDRIISAEPATPEEAAEKLSCLVNLLKRDTDDFASRSDIGPLIAAAQKTCGHLRADAAETSADTDPNASARGATGPGRAPASFGGSVAEYVTFADGRVSLIDTEFRYAATSAENAVFYDRTPVALMGAHVADMIGDARFATRARARLETCFSGIAQSYHHAVLSPIGARIMRCDMKPVSGSDGVRLGALVYMTDVTEQARRLRPSSHEVLSLPAAHRSY